MLLATWLVTREHGLPEGYAAIPYGWLLGVQVALLAIYLASTIVRTLLRGLTFTWFETAQCAVAFLISVGGGLRLSGGSPRHRAPSRCACAAACYVVSFVVLDRGAGRGRNFYTYSTFGILLVLAGSRILLSGAAAAVAWSVLAVAAIWVGGIFLRLTLKVHGTISCSSPWARRARWNRRPACCWAPVRGPEALPGPSGAARSRRPCATSSDPPRRVGNA